MKTTPPPSPRRGTRFGDPRGHRGGDPPLPCPAAPKTGARPRRRPRGGGPAPSTPRRVHPEPGQAPQEPVRQLGGRQQSKNQCADSAASPPPRASPTPELSARSEARPPPSSLSGSSELEAPGTSAPHAQRERRRASSTPRSWRTAYGLNEQGVPTRSDKPHPQPHVPCSRALPCIGGYPPCFNVSALREVNVPPWGTWRRWAQAGVLPQPRQPRRSNGDRPHSATTTSV